VHARGDSRVDLRTLTMLWQNSFSITRQSYKTDISLLTMNFCSYLKMAFFRVRQSWERPAFESCRFWVMRLKEKKKLNICSSLFHYYIKQIDCMFPSVCSAIDHRRRPNVVRTSVTYSAIAAGAKFLFLAHFNVICDHHWTDARQHGIYFLNSVFYLRHNDQLSIIFA